MKQQRKEHFVNRLQLVEEDFLKMYFYGFQEKKIETDYEIFYSKMNAKKTAFAMVSIIITLHWKRYSAASHILLTFLFHFPLFIVM
jgi:hypothetical protein